LGGLLGASGIPYRAAVLTGIGMGLLAIGLAAYRSAWMPLGAAVVAMLCKQLVVPILHVSVACKANSCLAVGLQALALSAILLLYGKRLHQGTPARVGGGASAALLAAGSFYLAGLRLAPCPYLVPFSRAGGLSAFLVAEVLPWAVASVVLFPIGYLLGERLARTTLAVRLKPRLYYLASVAIMASSWAARAFAVSAGL
jgi:hypothetical protein